MHINVTIAARLWFINGTYIFMRVMRLRVRRWGPHWGIINSTPFIGIAVLQLFRYGPKMI